MNISKETNYVQFHDSSVRHLSVQCINIKVLKNEVFTNGRYDAENGDQSKRVIHHFLRKTKRTKSLIFFVNLIIIKIMEIKLNIVFEKIPPAPHFLKS